MKRTGNLWDKIISKENLKQAHLKARRGKGHYREVKMVNKNPNFYLTKLHKQLKSGQFKTSPYITFEHFDRNKKREISKLPYYPDRIVHWAIMLQIEDVFHKNFILDTYASIPERGIHLAVKRINKAMKDVENTEFCLKFDIKKYFPSVDNDILKNLLKRKFKDEKLLGLLYEIIDSAKGIPIGNFLSQYFGNFYLSYFDHYIKSLGVKYYFRYMDDIVILHKNKTYLHGLFKSQIVPYLENNLKLTIKENWQVFPTRKRGLDFVGYRFFGNFILLRKSTYLKLRKKMSKSAENEHKKRSRASYSGWLTWANCFKLKLKYMKEA